MGEMIPYIDGQLTFELNSGNTADQLEWAEKFLSES